MAIKKKGLILVETPFQLLCAYEYLNQHPGYYDFFVRNSGVGTNDEQMRVMLEALGVHVKKTFFVKPKNLKSILFSTINFLLLTRRSYNHVVVGSYFSGVLKFFSNMVVKKEVVLLDDGVATLLADRIIKNKEIKKYLAFSIFQLDKENYKQVYLNSFNSLANKFMCSIHPDNCIFFIGQILVDMSAIELDDYVRLVEFAVNNSPDVIVHYIPHRAESSEVIHRIAAIPRVNILLADVAIEYYLLKNQWYPEKLYSVISTALYSLSCIFQKTQCIALRTTALKTELFQHYDLIIDAFSKRENITFQTVE
ncbi:hypothetical protein OQJ19_06305 [Fluoribacter gormanii]|uniref:Uncharacterized protein n=1 Tax=Fluoribacter gormanii TaxID=464 RepID=A0A377GF27_9GAMM|nr:hypothetical protein [Fluoribacter gormanii]KTD04616.1 hypothetical protein Lgor_0980 [Fluoribacter gormanii]MCW8445056.1 hypothetical protein [Fluoribacter gormanii]MCW8470266.1 hypothetical protein [Fluoribacter gormanii]SIR33742.1 hypothetical protein SAMN05421777_11091 [Fluoribacter gormanii]STO23378.1 Uncharacterised protein [Fluoribacter gormanii]